MAGRRSERRVATVLFLDIVDSTHIAGEVGDRRWRELLGEFRRRVRAELRRHRGHEQDTAGDAFFATFDRPADAVRAAVAIVAAAQVIGLDVRSGLHTGELERIDGRLGGIAAHIGARVMARAGAAEVLATGTVRELAIGGGTEFGPSDETELKGVPGLFRLHRVVSVDDELLPPPLTSEQATARLAPSAPRTRRVAPMVAGTAVVAALALAAAAALVLRPGSGPQVSSATPSPGAEVTLLKVDPAKNKVVGMVRDRYVSVGGSAPLFVVDGTLWQRTPISLVRRDIGTGGAVDVLNLPPETQNVFFAFGSIWIARIDPSFQHDVIERVNPTSLRVIATIDPKERIDSSAISRRAMWILTTTQELLEVDPNTNAVIKHKPISHEKRLAGLTAFGENLWICECGAGRVIEFDPSTDEVKHVVTFTQRGFVLPDERVSSQGAAVTTQENVMWLLDAMGGTITPVDPTTAKAGSAIGVPKPVSAQAFGFGDGAGDLWVTAGGILARVDLDSGRTTTIKIPAGIVVGGVALDEQTGVVWVSTCLPAPGQFSDTTDPCRPSGN